MKIGSIVFILIVLANVIGPLLQKWNEKARKQKQQGAALSGHPAQRTATSDPRTAATGLSRMEKLVARRQAQLEQLRQRREQRRTSSSTQQARIGPASTPTATPAPTQFRTSAPQPTSRPSQPATAQRSAPVPSTTKQTRPQPTKRRRVSRQPAVQPVERKGLGALHAAPALVEAPKAAPRPFLGGDTQTITPQLLRRLVVLKEIFDAPIALRNRDIWDRPG